MPLEMSFKTKMFVELLRTNVHDGPTHLQLLDAYFINRKKTLKFFYGRNPQTEMNVQVRGLFSTKNPEHFFILGSATHEGGYPFRLPVIIAYDTRTEAGSWCSFTSDISIMDFYGKDACPFDSKFTDTTTVFDDVVIDVLQKAPNNTLTLDEVQDQTGIPIPIRVLEPMKNRGKISWQHDGFRINSVSLLQTHTP